MHHIFILAALAITLSLTGCANFTPKEDSSRYFALRATSSTRIEASKTALSVGPLTLPAYLDRKEIVTAGGSNDLKIAEFQIWGESLDSAITRVVAENISQLLDNPAVAPFPDVVINEDYKTVILVRRFEMGVDHKVHLDASYTLKPALGSDRAPQSRFYKTSVDVLRPERYDEIVAAMSLALGELSEAIAQDVVSIDHQNRRQSCTNSLVKP